MLTGRRKTSIILLSLLVTFVVILMVIYPGKKQTQSEMTLEEQIEIYKPFYLKDGYSDEKLDGIFKENADKLLNNRLIVEEKITDDILYDIENIDWNMSVTASPNTFSLYLHTLSPVYYLCQAFIQTNDMKYLDAADKFVESWAAYAEGSNKINRYTWYDHSVAERTENLIFYSIIKESVGDGTTNSQISKLIDDNAKWLYDDDNYTHKHNHGIFEDGALIKSGYYMNNTQYIQKGINRLDEQLKYAFPNGQIHIENSLGYHIGIISYIKGVGDFLTQFNDKYAVTALNYYKGAVDYLVYVHKPNLSVPFIGDTIGSLGKPSSIQNDFGDANLKYIQTKGLEGSVPKEKVKVYLKDGTAIFREHWDATNFDQATWLLFKSGFLSSTHKHADDLSILLYSKGHDIFIDPGMYNYMVGTKLHDYMNSNMAHNTVMVDDQSYSVSMFNSNKVGLYSYKKNSGYMAVKGFNNIFSGVNIDRSVNYIDGDNYLIVDDILSNETHKYSQIFHLSNDVEVEELSEDHMILKIKGTNYHVLLQQLIPVDSVQKFTGGSDKAFLSFTSSGFNKSIPTSTVLFNKKGSNSKFITSLRILESNELKDIILDKPILEGDTVTFNEVQIDTSERERIPNTHIFASIDETKLELTNNVTTSTLQKLSYSFYLLDKETGRKHSSTPYSFDSNAVFDLEKGKNYAVISYLRNSAKETSKKLTGFVEFNGKDFVYNEVPKMEQEPAVKGSQVKKIGDRQYNFKVNLSGNHRLTSKWYIYKDGASYDFVGNNSNELTYNFTEPGKYTCIYRINDIYFGEIDFNNFEEIEVP
ncbi:MAG: alginate lyase family protein [Paenibacillus sp.]|nr:alginate lyase family protein [Paenibacillus sp.]